jgi:hypothetical protein
VDGGLRSGLSERASVGDYWIVGPLVTLRGSNV